MYRVARNFTGVYFYGLAIVLCFAGTNFAIRTGWFSRWELSFAIFRKYPVPSFDNIFVFSPVSVIEIVLYGMRTLCKTSN